MKYLSFTNLVCIECIGMSQHKRRCQQWQWRRQRQRKRSHCWMKWFRLKICWMGNIFRFDGRQDFKWRVKPLIHDSFARTIQKKRISESMQWIEIASFKCQVVLSFTLFVITSFGNVFATSKKKFSSQKWEAQIKWGNIHRHTQTHTRKKNRIRLHIYNTKDKRSVLNFNTHTTPHDTSVFKRKMCQYEKKYCTWTNEEKKHTHTHSTKNGLGKYGTKVLL